MSVNLMVYFILAEQTQLIKIGSTPERAIAKRIKQMQTENADSLKLLGVTNDFSELTIKAVFESSHHHGSWYKNSEALTKFIKDKTNKTVYFVKTGERSKNYGKFTKISGDALQGLSDKLLNQKF